jgi:hypothetical protein
MQFMSDDIEITFAGYISKTLPAHVPNCHYANAVAIKNESTREGVNAAKQSTSQRQMRVINSDLLHLRLGHRSTNAILTGSKHRIWEDMVAVSGADPFCTSCRVAVMPKQPRGRRPMGVPDKPLDWVSFDVIPNLAPSKVIVEDYHPYLLACVDVYSRKTSLIGMKGNKARDIIGALKKYIMEHGKFKKMRSDAGPEFLSAELKTWLNEPEQHIQFDASAPEGQNSNGFTE